MLLFNVTSLHPHSNLVEVYSSSFSGEEELQRFCDLLREAVSKHWSSNLNHINPTPEPVLMALDVCSIFTSQPFGR